MAICRVHTSQFVADKGTCSACKNCKHSNFFRSHFNPSWYQCCWCVYKTKEKPTGVEINFLNESNEWEKEV